MFQNLINRPIKFDYFCRDTTNDTVRRNIFNNNRTSRNSRTSAYCNSFQYNHIHSDPYVRFYSYLFIQTKVVILSGFCY